MTNNRDAMHAAGGAMFSKQVNREGAVSNSMGMAMGNATVIEVAVKKPQNRGPRVVLNMKDDFRLTQWLHGRTPVYGEQATEILSQALSFFSGSPIEGLNVDHVKTRLAAFADTLPKPVGAPLTLEEQVAVLASRVAELERFKYHFAEWFTTGGVSEEVRQNFAAYYADTDLGKL